MIFRCSDEIRRPRKNRPAFRIECSGNAPACCIFRNCQSAGRSKRRLDAIHYACRIISAPRWRCSHSASLRLLPARFSRCGQPSGCQAKRVMFMKQSKFSSIVPCSRPLQFRMGKDSRGNWVVQDDQGVCGGLFVDRKHALRFAMLENGSRPQAVVMVPGIFELDIGRCATAHDNANVPSQRKVA